MWGTGEHITWIKSVGASEFDSHPRHVLFDIVVIIGGGHL